MIFPHHLGNFATSIIKPIAYTSDSMLEVKALLSKTYCGWQACTSCTAEHILGQLAFNSLTAGLGIPEHNTIQAARSRQPSSVSSPSLISTLLLDGDKCPPAVLTKVKSPLPASNKSTKSAHVHTVKSTGKPHNPQLCVFCKGHKNNQCPAFKALDVETHRQQANSLHACYNFLSTRHQSRDCSSRRRCSSTTRCTSPLETRVQSQMPQPQR